MKKIEDLTLLEDISLNLYRPKSAAEIAEKFKTSRQHILTLANRLRVRGVKIPNLTIDGFVEELKIKHPEVFN